MSCTVYPSPPAPPPPPAGYTLMHPSFSRPLVEPQHPFHSDIGVVERRPGFARVRGRLLTASSGSETLRYTSWDRRGFNVSVSVAPEPTCSCSQHM